MWISKGTITIVILSVFASSCVGSSPNSSDEKPVQTDEGAPSTQAATPALPPDIDTTLHSVSLDTIVFDTFDGGSISLTDSTPEIRAALLDAIPPIDSPVYGSQEQGDWLESDDLVVGYVTVDNAYAYPFKILNYHEIINDSVDGVPILVSYCPLCRSAVVYDRRVDGTDLAFSNTSALHESDAVMVDRTTGSYWWQVAGAAIVGPLTGTSLEVLPSTVATWADWKRTHPATMVLTPDTGFARPYASDAFSSYADRVASGQFAFPVSEASLDDRLRAEALVVAVRVGETMRAYQVDDLETPINDTIGGSPIVILPTGGGGAAFVPIVDGTALTFDRRGGMLVDTETQSSWSPAGIAIEGRLAGSSLEPLPARTTFWFALVGAFPDVDVFTSP
jgi:hypothetical protein